MTASYAHLVHRSTWVRRRARRWTHPLISLWLAVALVATPGVGTAVLFRDASEAVGQALGRALSSASARLVAAAGIGAILALPSRPDSAAATVTSPGGRVFVGTNGSGLLVRGTSGWVQQNSGHDLTIVNVVLSPAGLRDVVYI